VDAGHGVCGPTEDDRAGECPHAAPTGPGATKWKRFPASATWSPGRWRI
jgi:hypothetical protein